jgi:hypothetical protein
LVARIGDAAGLGKARVAQGRAARLGAKHGFMGWAAYMGAGFYWDPAVLPPLRFSHALSIASIRIGNALLVCWSINAVSVLGGQIEAGVILKVLLSFALAQGPRGGAADRKQGGHQKHPLMTVSPLDRPVEP